MRQKKPTRKLKGNSKKRSHKLEKRSHKLEKRNINDSKDNQEENKNGNVDKTGEMAVVNRTRIESVTGGYFVEYVSDKGKIVTQNSPRGMFTIDHINLIDIKTEKRVKKEEIAKSCKLIMENLPLSILKLKESETRGKFHAIHPRTFGWYRGYTATEEVGGLVVRSWKLCNNIHCSVSELPGGPKFYCCSNCLTYYCSRSCQEQSWLTHSKLCKSIDSLQSHYKRFVLKTLDLPFIESRNFPNSREKCELLAKWLATAQIQKVIKFSRIDLKKETIIDPLAIFILETILETQSGHLSNNK